MYRISWGGYTRNWFIVAAYRKAFRMANRKKTEIVDNGCLLTFRNNYILYLWNLSY